MGITSAGTLAGTNEWEALAPIQKGGHGDRSSKSSLCFQSYAHARVTQLMRLYEASKFIDHNIIMELVNLANPEDCDEEEERVECIRAEALGIAVEAGLVVKGLTAMVTVENETCQKIDEGADICLDGTTPGDGSFDWDSGSKDDNIFIQYHDDDYNAGYNYADESYSGSGAESRGAVSFLLALLILVATL